MGPMSVMRSARGRVEHEAMGSPGSSSCCSSAVGRRQTSQILPRRRMKSPLRKQGTHRGKGGEDEVCIHSQAACKEVILLDLPRAFTRTCRSISSFPITSLNHLEAQLFNSGERTEKVNNCAHCYASRDVLAGQNYQFNHIFDLRN